MLDTSRFRFDTGAASDTGCIRDHNEDRFLPAPEMGIWMVADGMGGHEAGDVAAQIIVDQVASVRRAANAPDLQARFLDRLDRANDAIRDHAQRNGGATMGATMAALLVHDTGYAGIWCGDSRIYLIRDGAISQISRDHTEVQELLDSGAITPEQAATWPRRNVITRAVGVMPSVPVDQVYGTLRDRDTFVLCSDGLTGHLDDSEIAALTMGKPAQRACDALIAATLARGAHDNVTVLVIRCSLKTVLDGPELPRT